VSALETVLEIELGRLVVRGDDTALAELRALVIDAARRGTRQRGFVALRSGRVFFKHGPLAGWSALRHGLRGLVLRQLPPRLRELDNLEWLRLHGFGAPRPRLAGALYRGFLPVFQFLATDEVASAMTLAEILARGEPELRAASLELLAIDLAHLHGHGFSHRDLYARNLLVTGSGALRVHYLDCWRGGPGAGARGAAFDLGCLWLFASDPTPAIEQRRFFDAYAAERASIGAPLDRARLLRAAARARAREARRLAARRRPESTLPSPRLDWDVSGL
jgi:hypothetical protein